MTKLLVKNKKMSKTNSKTGASVFNFGITAAKTCPSAKLCLADCYARQGAYRFRNVVAAYENRYQATLLDNFVSVMDKEIKAKRSITHVRIHDSGDFYNREYLHKWFKIMSLNPGVKFYAYTKEIKLFKSEAHLLPDNFEVIFSYGGKHDKLIDKRKDRHAVVYESVQAIPTIYSNASDNDLLAIGKNKRVALAYHGNKKMTGFNKVRVK